MSNRCESGANRASRSGALAIHRLAEALAALSVELVKTAIEETPPELVADVMENGITLAGGQELRRTA